jgi:Na+/proline symporter
MLFSASALLAEGSQTSDALSSLTQLDFVIIAIYVALSLLLGVMMARRSRRSLADFFASGGQLPWYLLGTSMIATSFAADTPLALSGMVRSEGVSGNWYWWCGAAMTLAGVFFFARLWKRADLVTDTQFVELRYSGRPAKALRGFRALYFSLIYATIVLGWVNLAMVKIVGGLATPSDYATPAVDEPLERLLRWTGFIESSPMLLIGPEGKSPNRYKVEIVQTDRQTTLRAWRLERGKPVQPHQPLELEKPETLGQVAVWLNGLEGLHCEIPQTGVFLASTPASRLPAGILENLGEPLAFETLGARDGRAGIRVPSAGARLMADAETRESIDKRVLTVKILFLLFIVTVIYCAMGGLWGVAVTDFFQFFIAMGGCVYLAWVAVAHFGGVGGLVEQMRTLFGAPRADAMLAMMPPANSAELQAAIAADPGTIGAAGGAFVAMSWPKWLLYALLVWYSLGFTDGGSYLAQRMIAARSESDAALGYLWHGVGHYCLRMWPWLLIGMAGACLFPTLEAQRAAGLPLERYDPEMNYILVMRRFLGPGLLGLMVASFLAAYMSTVSSHVNLSAGYLVNDFYKPFFRPGASERHLIWVSSVATVFVAFIGGAVTLFMNSIVSAWFLLASINAGIGIVYILRWYWWRINAWSEIACFVSVAATTLLLQFAAWGHQYENGLNAPAKLSALQTAYYRQLDASPSLAWINAAAVSALNFETRQAALIDAEKAPASTPQEQAEAARLYRERTGQDVPDGKRALAVSDKLSLAAFPYNYLLLVPISLFCWLSVTLLTRPTDRERLRAFYRRVRPGGPGWRAIAAECPDVDSRDTLLTRRNFLAWFLSVTGIYSALFGVGELIIGHKSVGAGLLMASALCGLALWRHFAAEPSGAPRSKNAETPAQEAPATEEASEASVEAAASAQNAAEAFAPEAPPATEAKDASKISKKQQEIQ